MFPPPCTCGSACHPVKPISSTWNALCCHKVAPLAHPQACLLQGGVGRSFYSWQAQRKHASFVSTELFGPLLHTELKVLHLLFDYWLNVCSVLKGTKVWCVGSYFTHVLVMLIWRCRPSQTFINAALMHTHTHTHFYSHGCKETFPSFWS